MTGARGFDLAGAVSVTAGLALLVYALVDANDAGFRSAQTLVLAVAALVLLLAFVAIERGSRRRLVPLRIFGNRPLRGANLVTLLNTEAMFPTNGADPAEAGLASGLINTSQQLGGALGIAALVAVATARTASMLEDGADRLAALTEGFRAGFAGGALVAAAGAALAALPLPSTTSRRHAS